MVELIWDGKYDANGRRVTPVKVKRRDPIIILNDFKFPPNDVPPAVIDVVKHWSEWIDYWAGDIQLTG